MARFAIGDIQGCYNEFMQLLSKIHFTHGKDTLYLVGDLVNRGPDSLKVLRYIYRHQDSIVSVLGNHDIYLLARYAQVIVKGSDDTLDSVLTASDVGKLTGYLRSCPLVFQESDYILVHAGLHPDMSLNKIAKLNESVMHYLQSDNYYKFIGKIYGNKPNVWSDELSHIKQMRFMINSSTRMRFIDATTHALDYKFKGEVFNHPPELTPWFKVEMHSSIKKKILFGHWAALGFFHSEKFIALDTGCAWGRKLTAIDLDSFEIAQISAL
jgi:bis(5'-nucleosyl)-tetraphosphatase (symmetrical)